MSRGAPTIDVSKRAVSAPGPFNTPSLRKENYLREDHLLIVPPKGTGPAWGGQRPPAETTAISAASAASASARQREDQARQAMEEAHRAQVDATKAVEQAMARAAAAKAKADRVAAAVAEQEEKEAVDEEQKAPSPLPAADSSDADASAAVSVGAQSGESGGGDRPPQGALANVARRSWADGAGEDGDELDLPAMPLNGHPAAASSSSPEAMAAAEVWVEEVPVLSVGERVERVKVELELDPDLPLLAAVQQANELMGLEDAGSLTEQLSALLAAMGLYESDASRPGEYQLSTPHQTDDLAGAQQQQ